MKDVTNRKMFRKSAARDRLRQMGGIMSSSPELMGTVQRFADGSRGPVQADPRLVEQQRRQDRRFVGNLTYPFAAAADLVNIPAAALQNLTQDIQYGPIGRFTGMSDYGDVAPPDVTGTPAMQRVMNYMNTAEGDMFNVDVPSVIPGARADAEVQQPDASSMPELTQEQSESIFPPRTPTAPAPSPQTDAELAADARDSAPVAPQRRIEKPDPSESIPDPNIDFYGAEEKRKQGDNARKQMLEFLRNPNASEKDKNDAGLEMAGYKHPDEELSLEKRAEVNAQMFRRMMGRDPEEDKKIDGYNLAMLGFLIASGDSPNALENIARGAAAGVKNFQDTAKARQAREEKIKMAGLEKAIRDDETAKKVEIEERRIARGYQFQYFQSLIESSDRQVDLRTRLGFEKVKLEAQLQQQRELAEADNISAEKRAEYQSNATMLSGMLSSLGSVASVALGESDGTPEGLTSAIRDVLNDPEKMEQVKQLEALTSKVTSKDPLTVGRQVQELSTGTDAVRFQQLAEDQFAEAGVRDPSSTQVANLAQVLIKLNAEGKPLTSLPKVGSQQEIEDKMYTVTGFNSQGQPLYEPVGG